jgi:beta-glucanase (GH16 family)
MLLRLVCIVVVSALALYCASSKAEQDKKAAQAAREAAMEAAQQSAHEAQIAANRVPGAEEKRQTALTLRANLQAHAGFDAAHAKDAYRSEGYTLVWADEFDKPGRPDSANWTYEEGFIRNRELQWYQPENATVADGMLVIEAKREKKANPNYEAGGKGWRSGKEFADYTSASVTTKGLHSWKYGRFEMRGRIDTRPGLWPAWWTLGVDGRWPAGGEIDIMEYYRGVLLANVACASDNPREPEWWTTKKPLSTFNDAQWSNKFHLWRMDWDEKGIKLYVDGQLLNSVPLSDTVNQDKSGVNPFKAPQYMILNLAVGGESGGDPIETKFAARFEIDYVRVYQKAGK